MAQWANEADYRIGKIESGNDLIAALAWLHHKFVQIHPFNNGNGRTARAITDIVAQLFGFKNVRLYSRDEGAARNAYIIALRAADQHDYSLLESLIKSGLSS